MIISKPKDYEKMNAPLMKSMEINHYLASKVVEINRDLTPMLVKSNEMVANLLRQSMEQNQSLKNQLAFLHSKSIYLLPSSSSSLSNITPKLC
jgi:hypothetical protein